jgi:hypothetical protein
MSQLSTKKQELERQISDLETTLHDLKHKLHEEIEAEQHEAINHLEDYLAQADHKYANLRELLVTVLNEIRGLFGRESGKGNESFRP